MKYRDNIGSHTKLAVTGSAGFIGSSLVEALISRGATVVAIDSLCNSSLENIRHLLDNPNFIFVKADLKNLPDTFDVLDDCDAVFHLAANSDVRIGSFDTKIDFDNNLLATYNLLEKVRCSKSCRKILFTSTSTVYGDATQIPTPENYDQLIPVSLYGASKLACESLISGYSHIFGFQSAILRLANIVGPRNYHGIIFDFVRKLCVDPNSLEVLGDGKQNKSYLYVDDCIEAILATYLSLENNNIQIFNVGSEDKIDVFTIAHIITQEIGLDFVEIKCNCESKDGRGWRGDVKCMLLDSSKIKGLGWKAKHNSEEAVRRTVKQILSSRLMQIKIQKYRKSFL
jgi:UDP-glucose 4-epimerase